MQSNIRELNGLLSKHHDPTNKSIINKPGNTCYDLIMVAGHSFAQLNIESAIEPAPHYLLQLGFYLGILGGSFRCGG